ncbi:MAG: NlpC/P60 family protein [Mucilaginibacter sp.]
MSCDNPQPTYQYPAANKSVARDSQLIASPDSAGLYTRIETGKTTPEEIIAFARTLTGVPYLAGSTDPAQGFDCSGFITYVFNHFGITVPRRSMDFTNVNREVKVSDAKAGDLILFTGTDSTIRVVGHMGIVVSAAGAPVTFIHSTSGKAMGVTETSLNPYYTGRFEKIIRIFRQNDR